MKQYVQCKLRLVELPASCTTQWIEVRGAKKGAIIERLPDKVKWEVVEVYSGVKMNEDVLKEDQRQKRTGLPSLRDTAKDMRQKAKS